jgi:hypothetical protein
LLDFRCFFAGRGDDFTSDAGSVATAVVIDRVRFVEGRGDIGVDISFSLLEPFSYWYFAKRLLNAVDGGEESASGGSERLSSLD